MERRTGLLSLRPPCNQHNQDNYDEDDTVDVGVDDDHDDNGDVDDVDVYVVSNDDYDDDHLQEGDDFGGFTSYLAFTPRIFGALLGRAVQGKIS